MLAKYQFKCLKIMASNNRLLAIMAEYDSMTLHDFTKDERCVL